tara:strand:- start:483 stop:893 length:411 start_codon:yes stop_codon:yes gene_type:complete
MTTYEDFRDDLKNVKERLSMMDDGYWLKISDLHEESDPNYGKYPQIIIRGLDDPPKFKDNLNRRPVYNVEDDCYVSIYDKKDRNRVQYKHMVYQIPNQEKDLTIQKALREQLNMEKKSLKSIINLFGEIIEELIDN